MASQYLLLFVSLFTHNLLNCASAAVHGPGPNNLERDSDGSFRGKDSEHYGDSGHNVEFDHEVILGSVKEAEEFDKLSPEESKQRLREMLPKMDINSDKFIDRAELKQWIMNSFVKLSAEDAQERMQETDADGDGLVTWSEYLQDTFGGDVEEEEGEVYMSENGFLVKIEKMMFKAADTNGDGVLDIKEFEILTNPEDHNMMHPYLVNQTLIEKDKNSDGKLDFEEYIGDRGTQQDKAWLIAERDKFDHELDKNNDGVLDQEEIRAWVIPDNNEIAEEEVDHLFSMADDNRDDRLSYDEVVEHYDSFVGSEADDGDFLGEHFDDEL